MGGTSVHPHPRWSRSAGLRARVFYGRCCSRHQRRDSYNFSPEAHVLQLSRRALPFLLAVPLLAFAAPAAQAAPPAVTLSSPVGHQAVNPPSFAGTAGTKEWEGSEIGVDIYAGDTVAGKPVAVGNAIRGE